MPIGTGLTVKKDSNTLVKGFITRFISEDFFSQIVNICLYPAEFGAMSVNNGNSLIEYVRSYLIDLSRSCKNLKINNIKQIDGYVDLTTIILNIRETGNTVINYNNVFQHLPSADLSQQKVIQLAIQNQIDSMNNFRKTIDQVINDINIYYEISTISSGLINFDSLTEYVARPGTSPHEAAKLYKDNIITQYNELSKLHSIDKYESEKDYFIISDKSSVKDLAISLTNYISKDYSFFETGYKLFDSNIEGFESSSVHLITAPSNHGKSLFMVNIMSKVIENNMDKFESNDVILFITLEDDIRKLSRRVCSIFGNIKAEPIKLLYKAGYEVMQAAKVSGSEKEVQDRLIAMNESLLTSAIWNKTQDKINICFKHSSENTFSAGDISKFIDRLKVEGHNVKMVFVDYVDVMSACIKNSKSSDYEIHGQIVQELRNLSRQHKLPVITATQNSKISENVTTALNNTMVGDSYRKVRYSDFIYMCRMDSSKSVFDPSVIATTFPSSCFTSPNNIRPDILAKKAQIEEELVPYEVKITKSKDAGKDERTYMLMSKGNLRIYNDIEEYLGDLKRLETNSNRLEQDIKRLLGMSMSTISENFIEAEDASSILVSEMPPFADDDNPFIL